MFQWPLVQILLHGVMAIDWRIVTILQMNSTLVVKPLNGSFIPDETSSVLSAQQATFKTERESARNAVPVRWSSRKFELLADTFIAMLSLLYLLGAIGFGGLLFYYAISS